MKRAWPETSFGSEGVEHIFGKTSVDVRRLPDVCPPDIKTTCSWAVVAVVFVVVVEAATVVVF